VNDQLHSAGFIEEPFHDNSPLRRDHTERQMSRCEIISELSGARFAKAKFGYEPRGDFFADQASFATLFFFSEPALLRVTDPRSGPRLCEAQRFMVSMHGKNGVEALLDLVPSVALHGERSLLPGAVLCPTLTSDRRPLNSAF
jgi:hypothetical protein